MAACKLQLECPSKRFSLLFRRLRSTCNITRIGDVAELLLLLYRIPRVTTDGSKQEGDLKGGSC
jgi:hypothetical protein